MQDDFSLHAYDFSLPEKNIAQHPSEKRDSSKLFILKRETEENEHKKFKDIIDYFNKGDILVVNDTKVFPARLFGRKTSGGKVEVFLLELPRQNDQGNETTRYAEATVLIKSSKRPKIGSIIIIADDLHCKILEYFNNGQMRVELEYPAQFDIAELLLQHGSIPLPPYIERQSGTSAEDKERYQTIYASNTGAVAAPTAGLHFTPSLIEQLKKKGVELVQLTLHVGYGTFAPVRSQKIRNHQIHKEFFSLPEETAARINKARKEGGKIWAVGTTSVRTLEFCGDSSGKVHPKSGWCDLYILPGYKFSVVDNLITNFHLPQSSLLFLVSALCGREKLLKCYEEAIIRDYRFYSYGDAMAIISDNPQKAKF